MPIGCPTRSGRCKLCNATLDAAASGYCERPACQTRRQAEERAATVRAVQDRAAEAAAQASRRARPLLRQAARRIGAASLADVSHAIVPHVSPRIARRSAETEAAFLRHLGAIVAAAFNDAAQAAGREAAPDPDTQDRRVAALPDAPALRAACVACQGDCCLRGAATHAFLTADSIAFFRQANPDATAAEVREAYVSRLPEQGVLQSCVFHGVEGCCLPRGMRAEICNSWQCTWREALQRQIERKGGERAVVVGLARDHHQSPQRGARVAKVVTVDPDAGIRTHRDIALPGLRPKRM